MKVYIVFMMNYDWYDIAGVYTDRQKAEKKKQELEDEQSNFEDWYQCGISIIEKDLI